VSSQPLTLAAPRSALPRYATSREVAALAVAVGVVGFVLVATLIAIFPAAKAATATDASGAQAVPLLFGLVRPTLNPESMLLLLVVLASATGSFVHVATSFANYAGRNRFETSWLTWYLLRCPIGAALATVFYFVVRAGFFSGDAPSSAVNVYGIAAVAGFVGLFSRQATDKLRELFDTLFKTDGADQEVDPVLGSVSPNPVTVGDEPVRLTLNGSGFVRLSEVRVGGRALPTTSVGPTWLTVEVPPDDLRERRSVDVVVLNPGPCAASDPVVLTVHEPA
jgi:hypothetical protein